MCTRRESNVRVLIISNNVLSTQNNNGKTLFSFFRHLPRNRIAQIYFSPEKADHRLASSFFRITDSEILGILSLRAKSRFAGGELFESESDDAAEDRAIFPLNELSLKNFDSIRLLRELAWKFVHIDHDSLSAWVERFAPTVIFFCAGDSVFAYRIYEAVCAMVPLARKAVYVTDDYILPRRKISPFWWF